ncbi:MAG: biopolymer transporter ExbD [Planctomycetaceae bacterium]|nr:biopolymer transporter ExbD [Planctomycetaceae bacterium]
MSRSSSLPAKVDPQMTPMIDVVFQLLAFFLLTFRLASVEGDLALKLPAREMRESGFTEGRERFQIRLAADERGELAEWRLDEGPAGRGRGSLGLLRGELLARADAARAAGAPEPEAELVCDDRLRYEHVLAAIEHATTARDADGRSKPVLRKVRVAGAGR